MELALEAIDSRFEGVSYKAFDKCLKHPGHQDFLRLTELELGSLPAGCQSEGCPRQVQWRADRTVKLTLFAKSPLWPERFNCFDIRNGTDSVIYYRQTSDLDTPLTYPPSSGSDLRALRHDCS